MLNRLMHGVLLVNLLLIGSGAMLYVHERADHDPSRTSSNGPGNDCPICHLLLTGRAVPTLIAAFVCIDAPLPCPVRLFINDGRCVLRHDVRTPEPRGPPGLI